LLSSFVGLTLIKNMKKYSIILLFLFSGLFVMGSHNMAGDLTYTHLSGNSYKFTVRTFTSTANTTADRCELVVHFGNGDSAYAPRSNGPIGSCVNAKMGDATSFCFSTNKINIYEVIYSYSAYGTYKITVDDPNRSSGILNIANSVNSPFHLEAELVINPFLGANSSPTLNIPLVCSPPYSPYYYNPGTIDPEGDSLYYENFLRGSAGYTDPMASTAFYIDSLTGDVIWNQPITIGNYVYDIRITEWKNIGGNYIFAGSTMQEVWTSISSSASINETLQQSNIKIYPNPSYGPVNILLDNITFDSSPQLIIYNSLGIKVNTEISAIQNNILTISGLSSGIYFYELSREKTSVQGKFVILEKN
jgi:hypothetical protein